MYSEDTEEGKLASTPSPHASFREIVPSPMQCEFGTSPEETTQEN